MKYQEARRYHMRDMKNVTPEQFERDEQDEARYIGWITVFYLVVLVVFIVVH